MNLRMSKPYSTFDEIANELNTYGKELRSSLLTMFLNDRLSESVRLYNEELDRSVKFLEGRDSIAVLKAITKKKKREDREVINQYMEDNT